MALGQIDLAVTFSDGFASRTESITFDVVQMPYQYNTILSQATLNAFGAIAHYNYMCMKIPALEGVITVRGNQDLARQTELEADPPTRHVHTVEGNPNALAEASSGK